MPNYDATFYDYVNVGAIRSARHLLPHLISALQPASVLDVGCGQAAWLSVWQELGVSDFMGIDGGYVSRDRLLVPASHFVAHDLSTALDLGRRFDLVQSLEVAEHIPESSAATFIASLVQHGDLILFSAAPPGQGGDHHVNERSYDYWRERFAAHGYIPIDALRPQIIADAEIEPWYRYNSLLYASPARFTTLPNALRECRIPDGQTVPDFSPQLYRLRKRLVACLPVPVATSLAKWKERWIVRSLRTGAS